MENFLLYIAEDAFILIPVLYILSNIIKGTEKVNEKFIPLILLPIATIFSFFIIGFTASGFINGVLVTGATFFANKVTFKKK